MTDLTPEQLEIARFMKRARAVLRLNADDFGGVCGLKGTHRSRTVYRWEHAKLTPTGSVIKVIENLLEKHRRQEIAERRKATP